MGETVSATGATPPIATQAPTQPSSTAPSPSGADFYSSALKALNGLFDLHVTTAVGHVKKLDISATDPASAEAELDDPEAKIANTVINTVTGDSTVIYTGDFTSNADLMAIHKEALATAKAIRAEAIDLIKKVIEEFADLLNGKHGRGSLMSDAWSSRIIAIRDALLTLEINTIVSDELSAQKMPEVPLALHNLVQVYSNYLAAAGFQVTGALLAKATMRVGGLQDSATAEGASKVLLQLQFWRFPGRAWTAAERMAQQDMGPPPPDDASAPATELTNGVETFEALQWVALGAVQHARAGGDFPLPREPSIFARINANCRQIKEAAMRLEQQDTNQEAVSQRLLAALTQTREAVVRTNAGPTASRLFGATVEENARSLFNHPRPAYSADPDVTILIRKAWDLGTDQVCMQTVMQVDGDIVQILGKMNDGDRAFLTALHRDAVKDSVGQWRALFDVLVQAAKSFIGALRGAA